jgi:hypothetical protein
MEVDTWEKPKAEFQGFTPKEMAIGNAKKVNNSDLPF